MRSAKYRNLMRIYNKNIPASLRLPIARRQPNYWISIPQSRPRAVKCKNRLRLKRMIDVLGLHGVR